MEFQRHAVNTPKILAVDFANGFFLLEDFGHQLLHPELLAGTLAEENSPARLSAVNYYQQAESVLLDIQRVEPSPRVFAVVHRDYHSRNLMLLEDGALGVIDFQDAVIGPITYDLVSLLKDCYLRLPREQVVNRALAYKQRLETELPIGSISDDQFMRWFDLIGLQRHIKVLGIFARLALRDGKANYLKDLPLVIRYALEAAQGCEAAQGFNEGEAFYKWFVERIEPLLPAQDWYSDWRHAGDTSL